MTVLRYIAFHFAIGLLLFCGCGGQLPEPAEKPNIVWILLDAARADNFSCYGYSRKTSPNIDKLAEGGVLFEQHFAQGIYTRPSVSSYMTGRYFPVDYLNRPETVELIKPPAKEKLLTQILREAGYTSTIITPHLGMLPPTSRFGSSFDEYIYASPEVGRVAYASFGHVFKAITSWIHGHDRTAPHFLYIHVLDTHFPHNLDSPYDQWIDGEFSSDQIKGGTPVQQADSNFSEADQEHLRNLYDGGILYADEYVGRILDSFDKAGLTKNTVFLITSDHGDLLGEDGTSWGHFGADSSEILHVPFVMSGPGLPKHRRVGALTENADIVPTLVDLLQLSTDAMFDGISLVSAVRGRDDMIKRDVVFSKIHPPVNRAAAPTYILRTQRFKYVLNSASGRERLLAVPDLLNARQNIIGEFPEEADRLRSLVQTKYAPLWGQLTDLDALYIDALILETTLDKFSPREAIFDVGDSSATTAGQDSNRDGLWQFDQTNLSTCSGLENVPPLKFTMALQSGRYHVFALCLAAKDHLGFPASAFVFKAGDDRAFRRVETDSPVPGSEMRWDYVRLGIYDVSDGEFSIELDDDGDSHWVFIRGFRFIPVSEDDARSLSQTEAEAAEESLRALGYLN